MSGFQSVIRQMPKRAPKRRLSRHPKLTEEAMQLLLDEARKHADLMTYDELAARTGLTRGSVRVTMALLIREQRLKIDRVHRGTAISQREQDKSLSATCA